MNWLLEYAFRGFNLHKVCGNTSADNLPARKMYQKLFVRRSPPAHGRKSDNCFVQVGSKRKES